MKQEIKPEEYATLRLLINRFEYFENMQADIIRRMREVVGMHVAEDIDQMIVETVCMKLDASDDFMQGVHADEFPVGLGEYLDELQVSWEQYDHDKLRLRPKYLKHMLKLGFSEKDVVNQYTTLWDENESDRELPLVLEVMTRDRLESIVRKKLESEKG